MLFIKQMHLYSVTDKKELMSKKDVQIMCFVKGLQLFTTIEKLIL